MSFLTVLALRRRSVIILMILLLLGGGIIATTRLKIELFPHIEFPVVTVSTFYQSANPEAVADPVVRRAGRPDWHRPHVFVAARARATDSSTSRCSFGCSSRT